MSGPAVSDAFERCVWPDCPEAGLPVMCTAHAGCVPLPIAEKLAEAIRRNDLALWRGTLVVLRAHAAREAVPA